MKLTCALVAGFVEKQHSGIGVFTSTLDGLITAHVDDAMQFSSQVSRIVEEVVFLAMVVSVVETDKPPGADAVEPIVDEAFDIPFQPVNWMPLLLLYLGHLSFSYFFSR